MYLITGNTFRHLVPELLNDGFNYVLTEKVLCQDNLEQYFASHRAATGSNNAPTLKEVHNNTRLMSVVGEVTTPIHRGNCTVAMKQPISISDEPLAKRKRIPKKTFNI